MKKIFFIPILCVLTACGNSDSQESTSGDSSDEILKTTENSDPVSEKETLLRSLVGEHKLISVSALTGANTMIEYTLDEGTWSAAGSSNVGGMREGYDLELSQHDLDRLNSAKIVVTSDLTVYFSCMDKQYFNTPFDAEGMTYLLKTPAQDFYGMVPEALEAETTFLNDYLYLYAEDQIDEELIGAIDVVEVFADAVIVACSSAGQFEMSLFYGDCCDQSTYVFE